MKTKLFASLILVFLLTSCSKNDETLNQENNHNSSTVVDADGNVYHTVTIGTQTWLVENLKTTKYNDGTTVPNITSPTVWSKLTTGAYCNYDNDIANGNKYGSLYNWYAVNTGKLAPRGWHVPSDAEWIVLQKYVSTHLGVSSSVGKALAANSSWNLSTYKEYLGYDMMKSNSTGFTALAGGERYDDQFDGGGDFTWWWCTESYDSGSAYCAGLLNTQSGLIHDGGDKQWGASVRCIKD